MNGDLKKNQSEWWSPVLHCLRHAACRRNWHAVGMPPFFGAAHGAWKGFFLANSFNKWCLLTTFGKQCPRACMKLFVLACRARATTLDYIHYTLFVIIFVMFSLT